MPCKQCHMMANIFIYICICWVHHNYFTQKTRSNPFTLNYWCGAAQYTYDDLFRNYWCMKSWIPPNEGKQTYACVKLNQLWLSSTVRRFKFHGIYGTLETFPFNMTTQFSILMSKIACQINFFRISILFFIPVYGRKFSPCAMCNVCTTINKCALAQSIKYCCVCQVSVVQDKPSVLTTSMSWERQASAIHSILQGIKSLCNVGQPFLTFSIDSNFPASKLMILQFFP